MKITVLSLFPEILRGFFESSIMKRAVEKGLISYELVNIRDYAVDKHHKCDDEVYGGGAGMLMLADPLARAIEAAGARPKSAPPPEVPSSEVPHSEAPPSEALSPDSSPDGAGIEPRTVFLTPSGRLLNQAYAHDLAGEGHLVLICGRYEGIDQRIIDKYVDDEVSIGDYVLSSGEIAALVLVDSVYRLIPGVIAGESLAEESFAGHSGPVLLEYPRYTRPAIYDNVRVPDVLTSGHHAKIVEWRLREQLRKTLAYRPELLAQGALPKEALKLLKEITTEGGIHGPHPETSGPAAQAER